MVYVMRTRLRQLFSRDALVNGLRSLAWVAPMTVLIWIYAEREQIATQAVVFRVEAKNPANRVIDLSSPGPDGRNFTIRADLSGPQAGLQQVKEELERSALRIDNSELTSLAPGKYPYRAVRLLANDPLFVQHGVTIANVSPENIEVFVDPIVTRPVTVKLPPSVATFDAEFIPPVIDVTGPQSVLDAARDKGNLVATADLRDLQGDEARDLPNVQVTIPLSDPHVSLKSTIVRAQLTPKKAEVTGFVKSVPVFVLYPQDKKWDKGKADAAPFVNDIPVIGPADMFVEGDGPDGKKANIYRIDKGEAKAILDVRTADAPIPSNAVPDQSDHWANIRFDFGDTKVRAAPEAIKKLRFTFVDR